MNNHTGKDTSSMTPTQNRPASLSEIPYLARAMKATVITEVYESMAETARENGWSYEEYLAAVMDQQVAASVANSINTKIRAAKFGHEKTLEGFIFEHQPTAPRELISHLATSTFIAKADNVVLLGPPGVGKTHLAIGLGVRACHNGYSVYFDTASGWLRRLAEADSQGRLEAELKRIKKYKLIIIDEVGYLPFDIDTANLFFQLISSRYEQGSVIVTSNLEFARWGEPLGDEVIASATIDRLIHHAEVIALKGASYRTRHHTKRTPGR